MLNNNFFDIISAFYEHNSIEAFYQEANRLLTNGYNINELNNYKQTPLEYAITCCDYNYYIIKFLIDNGASINSIILRELFDCNENYYDDIKIIIIKRIITEDIKIKITNNTISNIVSFETKLINNGIDIYKLYDNLNIKLNEINITDIILPHIYLQNTEYKFPEDLSKYTFNNQLENDPYTLNVLPLNRLKKMFDITNTKVRPPIIVSKYYINDQVKYLIIEGRHRVFYYLINNITKIKAIIK